MLMFLPIPIFLRLIYYLFYYKQLIYYINISKSLNNSYCSKMTVVPKRSKKFNCVTYLLSSGRVVTVGVVFVCKQVQNMWYF